MQQVLNTNETKFLYFYCTAKLYKEYVRFFKAYAKRRPDFGGFNGGFNGGFGGGIQANARLLMKINTTVQQLVLAKVSAQANGTSYVWDLLPAVSRLILLNQVQFRKTWNVTERLASKATRLDWATIPADIQKTLLDQKASLAFLNLKFIDWGFVNSPAEQFANTTLLSLMPMDLQILVPTIKKSVDLISFDNIVNAVSLSSMPSKSSDILSELMNGFNNHPFRFKRSNSRERHGGFRFQPPPPPPSPFDVLRVSMMNAAMLVANAGLSPRFYF